MLVLTQIAGLIETQRRRRGASGSGVRVRRSMSNAWLLFMLPHSIITVSLVTVFYPRMSEHAARGRPARCGDDLSQALRIVLLVDGPRRRRAARRRACPSPRSSAARPQRRPTPWRSVLVAYLLGLLPFTALFVVQRCFYALADTRTPFRFTRRAAGGGRAGTLLLRACCRHRFTAAGIAAVVSLGAVRPARDRRALLLKRRIGSVLRPRLRAARWSRYLLAAAPGARGGPRWCCALTGGFGDGLDRREPMGRLRSATVLVGAVVAVVYLAVLAALRAPELEHRAMPARQRAPAADARGIAPASAEVDEAEWSRHSRRSHVDASGHHHRFRPRRLHRRDLRGAAPTCSRC